MKHFQDAYRGETITKEDLFYYVYGLLHSEDYRAKYGDNLSKELPRIPCVKTAADFWAFSRAGRELGDLHVNYETVEPYPVTIKQGDLRLADIKNPEAFYRVTKWAFGKAGKEKDKTTVVYNANITMQDIPLEAYDYVVNGKPALEWVMERQVVKTDKDSGIENDANRYAIETMNNPAYPLELFQRVITVSLRTMEIVRGLPRLVVAAYEGEPSTVPRIEAIKAGITKHWGETPSAWIALSIIDCIEKRRHVDSATLRVGDILRMLDMQELSGEVVSALAIVTQSEFAVLRSGGEFIDEDGRLHKLSPAEFQRVLNLDTLVHPLTESEVANASNRVWSIFEIATDLLRDRKQ